MQVRLSRRALLLASLSGSILSSAPAFAQDAPKTGYDDEIIVTAQKREENLQNVPISIQALGTRKLDQLNVTNFEDFSKLLPSVSFQSSQPGVTTVYMRGVASGGDGNHSGSLPSVGVYLDEQPVTTIGGTLDVHVYDIARIESLAGPQGTLYGASSQAGTIRIITNKPDTSGFEGRVDGEQQRQERRHGRQARRHDQCPAERPRRGPAGRLVPEGCRLYRQCAGDAQLPRRADPRPERRPDRQ
jgi:outer membrane receptor protein involved in Fe transport